MRTLALISSIATCFMACASPEPDDDEIDDVNWGGKGDGAISEDDFWADGGFYFVRITGWDPNRMTPARLQEAVTVSGAKVSVYRSKFASQEHCPSSGASDLIY